MSRTESQHVALVTGGSRGIGASICRRLADEGAAVFVAARTENRCGELADEIRSAGGTAWPLALDVTDQDSIESAIGSAREISQSVGPIDWLVNNAGLAESSPLIPKERGDSDEYRRHLEINFHGARLVSEALLLEMRERGYGRIVNLASSAGLRGYSYVAAYCASKFALVGYTLAAAHELAKTGVTVNAVCPYYVDSPMLAASIERLVAKTGRSAEAARDFFRSENPGGELVSVEEVANAVLLLLAGDDNATLVELDGSPEHAILRPNEEKARS